jgi:hypothetical protein
MDVLNHDSGSNPLDRLPFAEQAAFNSSEKQFDPLCLKDTRVEVLAEIRAWIHNVEDEKCVFWLSGMAGTGKSTIARTIARELHDSGYLGASFFFSRAGGDVGNARLFVTTIARQLAASRKLIVDRAQALRAGISEAVSDHPDIVRKTRQDQEKVLIIEPISQLDSRVGILELFKRMVSFHPPSRALVIIVDALDECEDENDIKNILQLLIQAGDLTAIRLRTIVTSRPETPIYLGLNAVPAIVHRQVILDDISRDTINRDIRAFFESNFALIRTKLGALSADWSGEDIVNNLVERVNALFIYAATVCRFLMEDERLSRERLTIVLQHIGTCRESLSPIDDIYTKVLQQTIPGNCKDNVREKVLWLFENVVKPLVVLLQPLDAVSVALLLDVEKEDVIGALRDLRSVLYIPTDPSSTIRPLHPSFREFLSDPRRCIDQRFVINDTRLHYHLFSHCFQVMSTGLKQYMCGFQHPGVGPTQLEGQSVDRYIPLHLQYSCRYWVTHLLRSGRTIEEDARVVVFLQKNLLHWLETLGWMDKVAEAVQMNIELSSLVVSIEPWRHVPYLANL